MYSLCGTLRVALVWLTAFMTLGSGVPQITCVCPDGRVKPFCLSVLPGLADCCCSDALPPAGGRVRACCCAGRTTSPSEAAGEKPCCKAKCSGVADKGQSHPQVGCRGCHKTVNPSAVVAVPSTSADQQRAGDLHAQVGDSALASYAGPSLPTSSAADTQRHPPDDLIVVLQRLII